MSESPTEAWCLRPARREDINAIHTMLCLPAVYRYLVDNEEPSQQAVVEWLDKSETDFARHQLGLWLLENGAGELGGCTRLDVNGTERSAELTCVLHPNRWGYGFATRMGWTVMQLAFERPEIEQITAGADAPNTASFGVMHRLGMDFFRDVVYPAGPGKEYRFQRGAPPPDPVPKLIPFLA